MALTILNPSDCFALAQLRVTVAHTGASEPINSAITQNKSTQTYLKIYKINLPLQFVKLTT